MQINLPVKLFLLGLLAAVAGFLWLGPIGLLGGVPALMPFAFGTVQSDNDAVRLLSAFGIVDAAGGVKLRIKAKTADYTILSPATSSAGDPSGTIFTNRGAAGAVTFTLPAPVAALAGVFYEFLGIADQNFAIAGAAVDTLLVVNDAAADTLTVSTASHKIGAHMRVVCDGTIWAAYGDSVGDTFTVAT